MAHDASNLREILVRARYEIAFRDGAWSECRVWNADGESWSGFLAALVAQGVLLHRYPRITRQ